MTGFEILNRCYVSDKDKHNWLDAMQYLIDNYDDFPESMDVDIQLDAQFRNFRFIRHTSGEIFFANCIQPGISKDDFDNFKQLNK